MLFMGESGDAQQGDGDVVDIGPGGTGHDQPVDGFQRMIGVVVGQDRVQVQPCRLQRGQTLMVGVTARGVCRSVGSVAADGEPAIPVQAASASS